jgi:hypothetical protein
MLVPEDEHEKAEIWPVFWTTKYIICKNIAVIT